MLTAEYETSDGLKIEITESKVTVSKEGHSIDISEADFDFITYKLSKFNEAKAVFNTNTVKVSDLPEFNKGW